MTLETQYRNFLRNNQGGFCSFEEWKKINARLVKQALINIMKDDEELGLYDEPKPFKDMLTMTEVNLAEFKKNPIPMKKETLEEEAHKILDDYGIKSMGQSIGVLEVKKLMVKMAKWQQQISYSEEEVIDLLLARDIELNSFGGIDKAKEWFEQFKNK